MKPLPRQDSTPAGPRHMPTLPLSPLGSHSVANRRVSGGCPIQRVYPWLLFASTAIAATFCLAYITKPVIVANPSPDIGAPFEREVAAAASTPAAKGTEKLLPDLGTLPGEIRTAPREAVPSASRASDFEETNIRIQHVLDAESPSGDISRIVIDVPVLYQTRNLHWTHEEAAEARVLLARLGEYQEKSRNLRDEGAVLLEQWDKLMASSIPSQSLRADSPSLPGNQQNPLHTGSPTASETTETIKLRRPEQ